ncbi:MAG TPA: long-chain-acyl-CoA synthetase [Deltaproteobacteria bacterium]|nr:long-chain-acyl-CoA synthetase [Deltaproteobacteria bacterium]HOI08451.1 long-chain-acyl-CoA synthetase [Deltaproteobacteria bacterium]
MSSTQPFSYRTVITPLEFLMKLPSILRRGPSILYNTVKGLRMLSSGANVTWGTVLEDIAGRFPDNVAIKSHDGTLTYSELNRAANRYAHFLLSKGVGLGDVVAECIESRPELLVLYCACAKIGAICAMVNTNQRGESLVHSFNLNKGKVIIIGEECSSFFEEVKSDIDLEGSLLYVMKDTGSSLPSGMEEISALASGMPDHNPPTTGQVPTKAPAAYVYTSGTTGLPKAAVIINKRILSAMFWWGRVVSPIRPDDTVYVPLPFFHTNALTVGWPAALYNGAAVALRRKFSASLFLSDVREFHVTHFVYVGEVCRYIMAQPARPDDHHNPLRSVIGNGLRPDIWKPFKKRFGIENIHEFYGAAEGVGIFTNLFNFDYTVGTSLTPYAIVRYDVENDAPERDEKGFLKRVKRGEAGLLIMEISEKTPFTGYSEKKKTEEKIIRDAFRKGDLWFNTGDMLRDMGFRHAQFVDRLGDTFRWKGENVATMEVEKALNSFPGISASAVYGVSMPAGDGKAGMASILALEGRSIDLKALTAHLRSSLPKYAVPLFIRFIDDFQMTATHKVKKTQLRKEGYDRASVKDHLYVLLPGSDTYVPVDDALYQDIMGGKYNF